MTILGIGELMNAEQIRKQYGMPEDGKGMNLFIEDPEFIPFEVEEEARSMNMDMEDPEVRKYVRSMVISDPDCMGDWDRYAQ